MPARPRSRAGEHVSALQLILSSDALLNQLSDLCLRFAKRLGHLASVFLVDLDDLQFGFRNFALRLSDRRNQLPVLAFETRCVSLIERRGASRNSALLLLKVISDCAVGPLPFSAQVIPRYDMMS